MGIKMSIRQEKLRPDGENCKNLQKSSTAGSHIQNICLAPVEKNRRDFYNDFCPMSAEPVFYFSLNPHENLNLYFTVKTVYYVKYLKACCGKTQEEKYSDFTHIEW